MSSDEMEKKDGVGDENLPKEENITQTGEGNSDTGFIDEESSIFTAPVKKQENPKQPKKSRVKRLIVALVIIILLTAAAVALALILKDDTGGDVGSSSASSSISVVNIQAEEISKVEVKNSYGSYVISADITENNASSEISSAASADSASSESSDINWVLEGVDERIPLDKDVISGIPEAAAVVNAQRQLGSSDRLADYGLNDPEITIKVTLNSGEEYTISLGSETSIGTGRYLYVTGLDAVYLAESGYEDTFNTSLTYFADLVLVSALEETSTYSDYFMNENLVGYDRIELSGSLYPQPVELIYAQDDALLAYQVSKPVPDYGNENIITDILSPLSSSLYATEAYVFSPDVAALKEYGFDNPISVVKYKLADINLTITVGKADSDGYHAVMINDIPAIYKVADTSLGFAMYTTDEIYYRSIFVEAIDDVSSVIFTVSDKTYQFDIEHTKTTTVGEDGEKTTTEDIIVRYNGAEISSDDFKTFYEYLLLMQSVESMPSDVPDVEAECILTFKHVDSSVEDTVLEFKQYSSRRYVAEKIGGRSLFIKSETVNNIKTYVENLINGVEVPRT